LAPSAELPSLSTGAANEEPVAATSETRDPPATTGEVPPNAELVPSAAAALDADQTLSAELQGSPSNSAISVPAADALGADARAAAAEREERRKQDALLIMNAQRRRRRARGY
jgi:hypothetical protein